MFVNSLKSNPLFDLESIDFEEHSSLSKKKKASLISLSVECSNLQAPLTWQRPHSTAEEEEELLLYL